MNSIKNENLDFLDNCKNCDCLSLECKYCKQREFYRHIDDKKKMKSNLKLIRKRRLRILTNSMDLPYWCYKHKCFHKYMYKGNKSKTYIDCLNANLSNFGGYKKYMKQSEIIHLTLNKSLRSYSIDSHKKAKGSRKQ